MGERDPESGTALAAPRQPATLVALVVIAVLGLLTAASVGYAAGGRPAPGDDSVEAGFARDMQNHHAQGVEMALVIREKSRDPVLRAVAYDIATAQQQQAGQMFGWLTQWGLSQTSSEAPMAWMSRSMSDMGPMSAGEHATMTLLPDGRMPGMASAADLDRLRKADGRAAEILFLRLMVAHHRGGVGMAQTAVDLAERPEVIRLAQSIVVAQNAEIEQLQQLLAARGQPPA